MALSKVSPMDSNEIRKKFVRFFKEKGHKLMAPSSLIPGESDSSVLFTTAGMQQFKRFYLNPSEAPTENVVTIQPCVRTSDIDEVGDATHLTFFEMLGNFSFGKYFKKETIEMAWEFLTDPKWLGIEKNRISATYFVGDEGKGLKPDDESRRILEQIEGLDKNKIKAQSFEDNFWTLGTDGSPAGPTAEFYIDGVEVWNLVFNEFIWRDGKYQPIPTKGVDTGMGLERLAAIMQDLPAMPEQGDGRRDKDDIFETDLFWPIIDTLSQELPLNYDIDREPLRIIADHLKSAAFLVAAGILPSNKDQGYIVRRLIRRALLHSQWQEQKADWIPKVIEKIIGIYPALESSKTIIINVIIKEIEKFQKTITRGKSMIEKLDTLDAKTVFDLYQTYGFPLELSKEYAAMKNIKISSEDLASEIERHRELSRTASVGMFKGGLANQDENTIKLHTAAHLLLAALRQVLGGDIKQAGSNINPERLRFDFTYPEKVSEDKLKQIEDLVNQKIDENLPITIQEMSLEEAKSSGATGVFDNRYGDKVKVYTIAPSTRSARSGSREEYFSREICGGPHVENTITLGHFKITKEESSSAGVRRIKAVLNNI